MKAKPPLKSPAGASLFDWPAETGRLAELADRVVVRRKTLKRKKGRARVAAAATAALVLFGLWAVPYFRETRSLSVPAASRQSFGLPDGSMAELNARTTVDTDFRYGRREVHLSQGEAFFSVVKDPSRPFIVVTPNGTVRVTGTQFDVRFEGNTLEVTLLEGSVRIDGGSPASLKPGEQFDSAESSLRALTPSQLSDATAWRQGEFSFDGLTLEQSMARLSRYYGLEIQVAPQLAALRPGGRIPLTEFPAVIPALESVLQVRVIPAGPGYQILPQ